MGEDVKNRATEAVQQAMNDFEETGCGTVGSILDKATTVYMDSSEIPDEHISREDLSWVRQNLEDLVAIVIYAAFWTGERVGSCNDKEKFLALAENLEHLVAAMKLPDNEIYKEVMFGDSGLGSLKEEYKLAAFKRGYDACINQLREAVRKTAHTIEGAEEADLKSITSKGSDAWAIRFGDPVTQKLREIYGRFIK